MAPLDDLNARLKTLHNLHMAYHLLYWDQNTQMPTGGNPARARQMATLRKIRHEMLTADTTRRLLEAADAHISADDPAYLILRAARQDYDDAVKLPSAFVAEYAQATADAFAVWKRAKAENDYAAYKPYLARIMELKRQEADLRGYPDHPYDAMLGVWERGLTTNRVRQIFDAHRADLLDLFAGVQAHAGRVDDSILHGHFPLESQRELALQASRAIGIDYDTWATFGTAPHPFCLQIAKHDIRVTTRYDETFFNPAFYGTLHESGHGLHGHGIAPEFDGTFLSDMENIAQSVAESQSRTWENLVGRSRAFWQWFTPQAQAAFPAQFGGADADALYRAVNRSRAQFSRVEADELTYNLHIMLRFEIELAWVEGEIGVDDLPDAWNAKMQDFFGITPPDVAHSVMDDIHWSMGGIGAFVGYALGNLLASQLYAAAERALPGLDDQIRRGTFAPLREWLTENIYRWGRAFTADELAERVTGDPLQAGDYKAYLRRKYTDLYDLPASRA
jgi:carboxypeptidase Taq